MSCKISRRSFLKVSGCLMLGSAVSGLLCGAGDPADGGAAVPTVGGLRVNYVRAFAKDYGNNFREMEIPLEIENTNDFPVYFNQENFLVHLGDMRLGINYRFSGLNKWNGSRYIQDVHLEPGECQTISYSCRLQAAELEAGLRQTDPAPWRIALLYGQQRQTFTGYLLADKYSSDFTAGPVESTAFPTVGGVQLSALWCDDSCTQNGFYDLLFYFTLQNKSDAEIALPFRGVSEGDVQDNFSVELDGQRKKHYRLCVYTHDKIFRPQEGGHLESLQPGESRLATNAISLTKEEYDTLYNGGHTVTFTFTCGDEKLTLRGDPSIGIFEAV